MKTFFKIIFSLTIFATFSGCIRSEEFDAATGITTQMDLGVEIINSEPMKANETWTNTKEFDVKEELKKRANINLDDVELLTFKILSVSAEINEARCKQLSSASTTFSLPVIPIVNPNYTFSGNALQALCGTKIMNINASTDANNVILTSDYAAGISRGDKIKITYSMTAREAFTQATGVTFRIVTSAQIKPK